MLKKEKEEEEEEDEEEIYKLKELRKGGEMKK